MVLSFDRNGADMDLIERSGLISSLEGENKGYEFKPTCSFVYKAYLALHTSIEGPADRVLCWLLQDGTLTWMTLNGVVVSIHCTQVMIDNDDFLSERFFLSTTTDEKWTCYTKSRIERDAWMHALMAVLKCDIPETNQTSEIDRKICLNEVNEKMHEWISTLESLTKNNPHGIWKETRHWKRFGTAERKPYVDLQGKINSTDHVDVLSLVIGLFVYQKNPMMIVTILAQLAVQTDTRMDEIELYWPQILHWGFTTWHTCQSINMQLFYLHFLAGVCRRSIKLAMKSSWECDAAKIDACRVKQPHLFYAITLMQCYSSQLSLNSVVTVDMVDTCFGVGDTPETTRAHQQLLQRLFSISDTLLSQDHTCLFGDWLAATTPSAIVSVRERILERDEKFLEPLPTSFEFKGIPFQSCSLRGQMVNSDDIDEMLALLNDLTVPETTIEPTRLEIFLDTMHLVNSLVVASQNFKLQMDNPKERKKLLPTVLSRLRRTMPAHAQLPLDPPCCITDVLVNEGTVFSTKARAPTMVWFEGHSMSRSITPAVVNPYSTTVYLADQLLVNVLDVSISNQSQIRQSNMTETHLTLLDSCIIETQQDFYSKKFLKYENFNEKKKRIKNEKKMENLNSNWNIIPIIAKSFDDMRQEVFVMQLMKLFLQIFQQENIGEPDQLWLHPYSIMSCGEDCGMMEVLIDSMSFSDVKKHYMNIGNGSPVTLMDIFMIRYGEINSPTFQIAKKNFIRSMAAYSLFCYILQIKDRHNGNLMLHDEGYVMHIDFGFCFGIAPGGSFSIERAPFKLTEEMISVMGIDGMNIYQTLVADGLVALNRHASRLLSLVYITAIGSPFPCFQTDIAISICKRMKDRLCVDIHEMEVIHQHAKALISRSAGSVRTKLYDQFQYRSNGYLI